MPVAAIGITTLIATAIKAVMGMMVARMLLGAGLALITYSGVDYLTDQVAGEIHALGGSVALPVMQVLIMAGLGEALDVVLSTISSTLAVVMAGRVMGVRSV